MSYSVPKASLVLLIFIFSIVWLVQPVPAFETYAPNDTLTDQGIDDVEWVDAGTLDVPWKTTSMDKAGIPIKVDVLYESGKYETVPYVLKVNDIDFGHTMARVSLAKAKEGAKPINAILFLKEKTNKTGRNLTGENTTEEDEDWCQIDHELKVQLTGMTEDSEKTPDIKFKYYKRGNPKLEIEIKSDIGSNNSKQVTKDSKKVNATTYIPGKDSEVKIKVKNSGKGWIESVKLDVNLTDFDLVNSRENHSESNIQTHGNHLLAELGWLAKNEERSINFTIRSPSWSEVNSRLKLSQSNITAIATGNDILGYEHEGNKTLSLNPPKPDIEASQLIHPYSYSFEKIYQANNNRSGSNSTAKATNSSSRNEISMSSWYIKGSEVHDLRGFFAVRQTVNNLQGYYLENLSYAFPSVPEGLIVCKVKEYEDSDTSSSPGYSWSTDSAEILGNTSPNPFDGTLSKSISGMKSNKADYILIPTRPGTYQLGSFSVNTKYEGYNLSEKSETASLIVHGPLIVVNKSIKTSEGDKVDVAVTVKNCGDRVASTNLTERIPAEAGMVQSSIDISRNGKPENDSIPLRNWELETHKDKNSTSILMNFPLRPNEYYDLKYSIQPGNLSNMDLPPAKVNFVDLNAYKGTVYSSFFKSGAEVKQEWDYYENRWKVTSKNWNSSTGEWKEGWDPIANRWADEIYSANTSANGTELENNSLIEPSKEKSTLDKIMDFIFGLLPWGKKASGPSNSSEQSNLSEEPAQNTSSNEPVIIKIKNFVTGLLPGGKQNSSPAPSVTPNPNPSNNQQSGTD